MSEHPHAGRIAAVAYFSAACALLECGKEALRESGFDVGGQNAETDAIGRAFFELEQAADEVMRPCEVANVLQTVEEYIANGARITLTGYPLGADPHLGYRQRIITSIVDARQAAKADEALPDCAKASERTYEETGADVDDVGCGPREPSDDEIYNGHGMEGGIAHGSDLTGGVER